MSDSSIPKSKLLAIIFFVIAALTAILVYALQFSALSYRLECSRQAERCILTREMVVGGAKKDVIPIEEIKRIDVSLHSHTHNVWIVTDQERFPLGSFSNKKSEANQLREDLETYIHDPKKDTFSYLWREPQNSRTE
jgi:hypothetical protein